ncbi:MAG: hypothetical protein N3F05_00585 [Candidatus Diapherotrites archaeon]|nr:hypothetical protein [Candidatus Diapherotrites archaeon]
MAKIFFGDEHLPVCETNIEAISKNSKAVLSFTFREVFQQKTFAENAKLLEICLKAMKYKGIRFFSVPFCVAEPEKVSVFNSLALKVKSGFYFEGAYMVPLDS